MIGKLTGIVDSIDGSHLILDVVGVGYLVACSARTLSQAIPGQSLSLLVETCVKEDSISLYGFLTRADKFCFLELTTVKGIGPRIALQVLGVLTPEQICVGINTKDKKMFAGISGVGPRIQERMFAELKDRKFITDFEISASSSSDGQTQRQQGSRSLREDAIDVLVNLGVNKAIAFGLVSQVLSENPEVNLNDVIKQSLSEMSVR